MNPVNNELPREVENAIRNLRDNDAFVKEVGSILYAYRDIRSLEADTLKLKDRKKIYDRVLTTLVSHIQAIHAIPEGYGIGFQARYLDDLQRMREHWSAHRAGLDGIDGRSSKQESLLWLTRQLSRIFETWSVPQENLSGFLKATLPAISPGNSPAPRTIDDAISALRN